MLATSGVRLGEPWLEDGVCYWREGRPAEGGRGVVVRGDAFSEPRDVTPAGFNVRTRVHEYGGGAYWVHRETVFFANWDDQRLYRIDPGSEPVPITAETGGRHRYADGRVTADGSLVVCVRERHEDDGVINELAVIPAAGGEGRTIAGGHDFYSNPRISPDGAELAWLSWDFPNMPWDGTELWVADLGADGSLSNERLVAGGASESIFQPEWSPSGELHFASDRSGWWNLYREGTDGSLKPARMEFGWPMWVFGYAAYGFLEDGRIACLYEPGDGTQRIALLDPATSELLDLDLPHTAFDSPYVRASGSQLLFVGGGPMLPAQVVSLDFSSRAVEVLRESEDLEVDPGYLSVPRMIEFPTDLGTAYAHYYPSANADFEGPADERPPLIVSSHGGPTGESTQEFDLSIRYFTSRGFAVVDVNYGGSAGFGRAYRERLKGMWGITDTVDCINAAKFLAEQGDVDGERLAIRGGSAGGYTTLCALTFHDDFSAGASYFGVADAEALELDTHKFESRYLEGLIGPYPEQAELFRARSPIHFTDMLSCPLILLQGLEDEVVPPAQAERMVEALEAKGLPYAYVAFEGEQHGFRKAENIERANEAELYFYSRVFGFDLGDPVEPVEIHNL